MVNLNNLKDTSGIKIPKEVINQIVGQEEAVNIIKKASKQRRNVLLVGQPGTGKSMLGQALAELLPKENLVDVLSFPNPQDENTPLIKILEKGKGRGFVNELKMRNIGSFRSQSLLLFALAVLAMVTPWWIRKSYGDIMAAASLIGGLIFLGVFTLFLGVGKRIKIGSKVDVPKLLVDNFERDNAPFFDASGAHAGALFGDVLHDPLQSGGLGTPSHERLVPGMIHRANKGVLFVDEIAVLHMRTQQELLSAMQEKKYPITGQSERSSGAMTRSEPVPCDFILVAAGTLDTIGKVHPALRSRIRGYGYEVYMNDTMDDNLDNKEKIVQFIAQEVVKDGKISHFDRGAVLEIINEAKKRAGIAGKLTLRLRELGGLVRAAGDIALEEGSKFVGKKHIIAAKQLARTLEQQLADKYIEDKKRYEVIVVNGERVGRVNGLAVLGGDGGFSGIVLPIESEVTLGGNKTEFIATGKLGEIAKEAVKNVSAIILKYFGEDIREKYDIYTQFIQTTEGVEGDSASIAVATSIISALKGIPVRQDTAMTGSLSVRGEVMAVGGVTQKIEAAIGAGIKRVIIPKVNEKDVLLSRADFGKVKIIPAEDIRDVLRESLILKRKKGALGGLV